MAQTDATLGAARHLYAKGPLLQRMLQQYRPYICPFDLMAEQIPRGARVLDVGCGSGLFLGLLANRGAIGPSVGFDVRLAAITMAHSMRARLSQPELLAFRLVPAGAAWPCGTFDVVSMVDVMHHVPPAHQESVFDRAATALQPGGLFLYKDMVDRPTWRAWANRFHDLLLSRQWIHYLPIDRAIAAAERVGFRLVTRASVNLWWYGHEMAVFRRL